MKQLKFCSFSTFSIVLIHVLVCLSASLVSTEGFDSLLELPHSGSNRTRSKSKRVIFVGDFGAKGDGFNDDTEVTYLQLELHMLFLLVCLTGSVFELEK